MGTYTPSCPISTAIVAVTLSDLGHANAIAALLWRSTPRRPSARASAVRLVHGAGEILQDVGMAAIRLRMARHRPIGPSAVAYRLQPVIAAIRPGLACRPSSLPRGRASPPDAHLPLAVVRSPRPSKVCEVVVAVCAGFTGPTRTCACRSRPVRHTCVGPVRPPPFAYSVTVL